MFSRPWLSLLRRQVLIHRRLLAFLLTVAAVLLAWSAFVARPPVLAAAPSPVALASAAPPALPPGFVRLPVRFADGEMASLLRPGEQIQLWATDPRSSAAKVVASNAVVMSLPEVPHSGVTSGRQGRLLVVGVRVTEVNKVTISGVEGFLTYTFAH